MMELLTLQTGLAEIQVFSWIVLPVLIFVARICDVTIGTVRVIFVTRGYKYLAACAGFFEVLIWITAMGQIMKNLSNPICYVAYAAGFATGNFVGILIVEKLSMGFVVVRVVFNKDIKALMESVRKAGYGITCFDGQGAYGPVKQIFTVVSRREVNDFLGLIKNHHPDAFYVIEEIDTVSRAYPMAKKALSEGSKMGFRPFRKGK
ncbi:MAG: DUF2179 domain-containing protein [Sedimentisphaerales bacterium]|nr:DUF2179 domain-containing protein [Sedimentisphaerales bacterium]